MTWTFAHSQVQVTVALLKACSVVTRPGFNSAVLTMVCDGCHLLAALLCVAGPAQDLHTVMLDLETAQPISLSIQGRVGGGTFGGVFSCRVRGEAGSILSHRHTTHRAQCLKEQHLLQQQQDNNDDSGDGDGNGHAQPAGDDGSEELFCIKLLKLPDLLQGIPSCATSAMRSMSREIVGQSRAEEAEGVAKSLGLVLIVTPAQPASEAAGKAAAVEAASAYRAAFECLRPSERPAGAPSRISKTQPPGESSTWNHSSSTTAAIDWDAVEQRAPLWH